MRSVPGRELRDKRIRSPPWQFGELALAFRRLGATRSVAIVAFSAAVTIVLFGGDDSKDRRAPPPRNAPGAAAPKVVMPPPTPPKPPGDDVQSVSVEKLVGQRLIARLSGTHADKSTLKRARAGKIGGVILFTDNITSVHQTRALVGSLQRAASDGGNPPLWVMVDQEGGDVRRFSTLPPRRSAAQLGSGNRARASSLAAGRLTATALRRAGVNVNLAPVADVRRVPSVFLKTRSFGSTATAVAPAACAFAEGLREQGVLPTLKHFPGLGYATTNTDDAPTRIDTLTAPLRADLAVYRRCPNPGLVMISSAQYPILLGNDLPAVMVRRVYRHLLANTGFQGITVSDDLQTPALAGRRGLAVRVARAGLDLLLYARDPAESEQAHAQLMTAARRTRLRVSSLRDAYLRIVKAKASWLATGGLAKRRLR